MCKENQRQMEGFLYVLVSVVLLVDTSSRDITHFILKG